VAAHIPGFHLGFSSRGGVSVTIAELRGAKIFQRILSAMGKLMLVNLLILGGLGVLPQEFLTSETVSGGF
jgi:hypothetical protein